MTNFNNEEKILEEKFNNAKDNFLKNKIKEAKAGFLNLLKSNQDSFSINYFLGKVALKEKDYKGASEYAEKIINVYPDQLKSWLLLIDTLIAEDKIDEAILRSKEALNIKNNNDAINYIIGKLYLDKKDNDKAIQYFHNSLTLNNNYNSSKLGLALAYINQENFSQALTVINEFLESDDKNIQGINTIAFCYNKLNEFDKSIEYYKKSLDLNNSQPSVHYSIGSILTILERYDEAIPYYEEAINHNLMDPNLYNNFGQTLIFKKNITDSERIYLQGLEVFKDNLLLINNLALLYLNSNQLDEAEKLLFRSIELKEEQFDVLTNLGNIYALTNQPIKAVNFYRKALNIDKDNYIILNNLGKVLNDLGKFDEALDYINKSINIKKDYAKAHNNHSSCQYSLGNIDKALDSGKKALKYGKDKNDLSEISNNLGNCYKVKGNKDKAIHFYNKAIEYNIACYEAYMSLVYLEKYKTNAKIVSNMLEILENDILSLNAQGTIYFSLYKVFEDNNKFDEAFSYLDRANKIYQKINPIFDVKNLQKDYSIKKKVYNHSKISEFGKKGYMNKSPIFIIGMPRSGTSLVEQILTSHSKVSGAGELTKIGKMKHKIIHKETSELEDKKFINYVDENLVTKLTDKEREELGQEYMNYISQFLEKNALHVTDKMPGNYINVGFIKMILPKAKFIHISRNPLDNCFSLYSLRFHRGHEFSYNMEWLAQNYNLYLDIMNYWREYFSEDIFDIKYEDLVSNLDQYVEEILSFCNLEFEENCLNFHNNKRIVLTASTNQVRKKIYSSSVERWKKYKKNLKPLIRSLEKKL